MNLSGTAVRLPVLTAAIAAGFAGHAHAAFITTSGGAGLPITLDMTDPKTLAVDLDNNGSTDYTLSSGSTGISINGVTNRIFEFLGTATSFSSPSAIDPQASGVKFQTSAFVASPNSSGNIKTNFSSGTTGYLGLEFAGPTGGTNLGFIGGKVDVTGPSGAESAAFTVTSFGYDPNVLPEPASLTLLAAGAVGLAAFRRRRTAQAA